MKIANLFKYFTSTPHGHWTVQWPNIPILYNLVKTHKPKKILDLGTGVGLSLSVMAQAMLDAGETDFHIDSIEQFDKCVKLANKMIPEEYKKYITIHKSEAVIWEDPNVLYQPFSTYKELPEIEYNFILNDGPGPYKEQGVENLIDFPNGTISKLLLEGKLKKDALIAFDGRVSSLQLLERYYGDNFWMYQLAPKGTDLNILQVKDEVAKYHDTRLEQISELGYFKDEEKYEKSEERKEPNVEG